MKNPNMESKDNHYKIIMFLFSFSLAIFSLAKYNSTGDSVPAETLPISIIKEHDLDFDEFVETRGYGHWYIDRNGTTVSRYPIIPGILNTPVYIIAHLIGIDISKKEHELSHVTSSILAAFSVVFMYLYLVRICKKKENALMFSFFYAFATCVWSVASTALWQHGPSLFFITIALAMLVRTETNLLGYAGFFLGMAVFNRPTNIAIALPLAMHVFLNQKKHRGKFIFSAAIPAIFLCLYSYKYLGSITALGQGQGHPDEFSTPFLEGLAGILGSPNRGILVFSPFLIFGFIYSLMTLISKKTKSLDRWLAVSIILLLIIYSKWRMWWGGWSFGYRIIIEIIPMLIIFTTQVWESKIEKQKILKVIFLALVLLSIYIQFLGAHYYQCGFNAGPPNIDDYPERLWDFKEGELVRCTKNLWADLIEKYKEPAVIDLSFSNWSVQKKS
jgi:hypothetical protein